MSASLPDLDRLEALFAEREPAVRAFLPEEGRFDRLRRDAERLQERWPDPAQRPPLFGVLVGVKDIFHVDGFPTRGGSKLPPEVLAGPQASCVTALQEAGALIAGKAVSTEFAYFAPGPTRNPWNPEHTPGGSSSGSAAGVAAGLCDLALGTQTIGSILRPAAYCGVTGFKPSYGRIAKVFTAVRREGSMAAAQSESSGRSLLRGLHRPWLLGAGSLLMAAGQANDLVRGRRGKTRRRTVGFSSNPRSSLLVADNCRFYRDSAWGYVSSLGTFRPSTASPNFRENL